MARDLSRSESRSPSYRRRRLPSPSRRSRRDRSQSPYSSYSYSRHKSRSIFPRRRKSRSPTQRRRKSRSPTPSRRRTRSPTPKCCKKQRNRSSSLSPLPKSSAPTLESVECENATEILKKEDKKRRQLEAELELIEEETAKRVEETIWKMVNESLNSVEIITEIQWRLEEGRKRLHHEVAALLEKEKEVVLIEARQKEEQARKEKEKLQKLIEDGERRVDEAQRREALEQQRKEEERYRELEQLQRQKEEAMRRKKQEEEEERLNQIKLLGKNKSRPKVSFALGSR